MELPEQPATHTRFLNASAAYQALSTELRQRISGLMWKSLSGARAPIARARPVSGQALLFLPYRFPDTAGGAISLRQELHRLNPNSLPRVEGTTDEQAEDLVVQLARLATSDDRWQYSHTWRRGDLVIWDQACVYHHAEKSPNRRVLHRTAVRGKAALAFVEARVEHIGDIA